MRRHHHYSPLRHWNVGPGKVGIVGLGGLGHRGVEFARAFGAQVVLFTTWAAFQETQEMLDFCAEHHIVSDIELIRIDQINEAYDRMLKNDVRYGFVIDMHSLRG